MGEYPLDNLGMFHAVKILEEIRWISYSDLYFAELKLVVLK